MTERHEMQFNVLLDSELDFSKMKYSRSTKKMLKQTSGNELGIEKKPMILVKDPRPPFDLADQLQQTHICNPCSPAQLAPSSDVSLSLTSLTSPVSSLQSSTPSVRRRPVPVPSQHRTMSLSRAISLLTFLSSA